MLRVSLHRLCATDQVLSVEKTQLEIEKAQERIMKVEHDAFQLGYPRLLNKKGDISGIGQQMPSITERVGKTLDREADYRLLSAIAHGHHWAIYQVGFRVIEITTAEGRVEKALEKHVHPSFILYVGNIAVTSFAKVIWYLWHLYGWNMKELEQLLDTTYDQLRYKRHLRFWI